MTINPHLASNLAHAASTSSRQYILTQGMHSMKAMLYKLKPSAERLTPTADLAMTKLQDDGGFELQTKRWTELIELRQALTGHKRDPTGIDIAIADVFDPEKGHFIDSIIVDGKDLMATVLQLEELKIDSTNVKMTLAKILFPGASGTHAADLVKLKGMIKMREQMSGMGIPTGCIEAAIADIFKAKSVIHGVGDLTDRTQPLSALAEIVKLEEALKVSVTEQPLPMAETLEPAELDASGTTITKHSTAGTGKPAELEDSGATIIARSLSSTEMASLQRVCLTLLRRGLYQLAQRPATLPRWRLNPLPWRFRR